MLVILEMIGAYVIYSICIDAFPIDFSVNLQERLAISIIKEILVFIFLVVNATVYSRIFFKFTRHGFILTLTNMLAGLGVFSPILLYVITRKLK